MVRVGRPLPDEPHAPTVDSCREPEDIRRPGHGAWSAPLALRGARRRLVITPRAAARPDRLAPASGRRPRARLLSLIGPGRRRRRASLNLEHHPRRCGLLPSQEIARGRTCREDERCEHHRPWPANRPRSSWDRDRRRVRPPGNGHARVWRRGERSGGWLVAGVGEHRPGPLGEHVVDQRELRTDRTEVCVAALSCSERLLRTHRRIGAVG